MAGHNAAEGFYSVLLAGDRPRCFGAKNVREGKKGPCVPLVDGGVTPGGFDQPPPPC